MKKQARAQVRVLPSGLWTVQPEWAGKRAFIVCGGPSLATVDLDVLIGHRVIAINTSYQRVPFANFLIFGDARWWRLHRRQIEKFQGRIVSVVALNEKGLLQLARTQMRHGRPTYGDRPDEVMFQGTTLTAAMNMAVHLGVKSIVLVGADGRNGTGGRTHHHAPHPWPQRPDCFERQRQPLEVMAGELGRRGIEVINATPGSAWPFWPIKRLEECL